MSKIYYMNGYKYQLCETYIHPVNISGYHVKTDYVSLSPTGLLMIMKGYAWDGPSGPTVDTKTFMRGSLVHDALYQLLRLKLLPPEFRRVADKEIRKICLEDGMNKIRAWYIYRALVRAGGFAADPKNAKCVLQAP